MAHFHWRVRVGSVCKGAARVAFPPPKVGVSRTRLALLLRWGTPERVRASSTYTRHLLIGPQNRTSVRQGDNNEPTHYPRDSEKRAKTEKKKKNVAQRFAVLLGRPTMLLVHCARSFSLDLLAGYTVWGCYEVTMLT